MEMEENPIKPKTRLETILKEIGKEEENLINEMKSSYWVEHLVKTITSTIHGSPKSYGLDCCRLIISSFSPKIMIHNPETKMSRIVRGTEAHLLTGLPSTAKSSWFSIIENQGLNVIKTQISTQGGILGTPLDRGLSEYLQNSTWLLPEAEHSLSNPTIVNILRSLIEEQEVGKTSAYIVSKTRLLKIHSSVCLSLVRIPKTAREFQLLSRLYRVNFEYESFEEVFDIGEKLSQSLMQIPEETQDFEPEPRHYLGLIAAKILESGLNENKFFCSLSSEHKRELLNSWKNLVQEKYDTRIPKGIALRDLIEGFRGTQNYGLLNFFQRNRVKQGSLTVLQLNEEDLKHGLEFMERCIENRSKYEVEEMKETRFRVPLSKIIKIYELDKKGLSIRKIAKETRLSAATVSKYLKQIRGFYEV